MRKWQKAGLVLVTACIVGVAGCSPTASALSKFQSGQIGSLSAAEWQALAGLGTSFGAPIPHLTPAQAEAIVNFLRANGIETVDELQQVIESGDVEIPQDLIDLYDTVA
jgi:hypothetical protein